MTLKIKPMPKKYKQLYIPELPQDLEEVQAAHCDITEDCADSCDNCLFSNTNLQQFTEYFNKKRYYGK